jgi:hypothetical protein
MKCAHCSTDFAPKPWPTTKNLYCSTPCMKRASYERHKAETYARQRARIAENPEPSREAKRKWNRSEKGMTNRRDWARRNGKRTYAKIRGPENTAKVQARIRSRAKLLTHDPTMGCVAPPPHRGRIECHHRDGNPLNKALRNLEWRCKAHHIALHPARNGRTGRGAGDPGSSRPPARSSGRTQP